MLVSRMVNTGATDRVVAAEIDPRQFADQAMREVYEMCVMHYRIWGTSPSIEVVKSRFPDVQLRPTTDDLAFLISEFKMISAFRIAVTKWKDIGLELDKAEAGDRERLQRIPEIFMEHAREMASLAAGSQVTRLTDMASRVKVAREQQESGAIPGVATPHRGLDPYLPSLKPTQFVVFTAASGVGKTTGLVRQGIEAFEAGKNVTMVSLEMDDEEIWEMFDARYAQLSRKAIERRQIGAEDWSRYEQAASQVARAKNEVSVICPSGDVTIDVLAGYVERTRPDVLLVDYVSLMKPIIKAKHSEWESVSEISAALKQLARHFRIVVCAAAQNNREAVDVGPTENNIAFSKTIFNDCNVMIGYHQDAEMQRVGKVQVRLIKNRRGDRGPLGPSGYFETYEKWDRDRFLFEPWSDAKHAWGARAGMGAVGG